jgi:hypothetical protein
MPDKWNFSFSYYYFCIILSILYIPGTTSQHNFPTFSDRHCNEVGSEKTLCCFILMTLRVSVLVPLYAHSKEEGLIKGKSCIILHKGFLVLEYPVT